MSEFEMAYLLNDIQLAITANSSMLFTIVSTFLVASYVAAHRLSPLMIGILLGIYAYAFLGTALAIERQMASMFGLGIKLRHRRWPEINFIGTLSPIRGRHHRNALSCRW